MGVNIYYVIRDILTEIHSRYIPSLSSLTVQFPTSKNITFGGAVCLFLISVYHQKTLFPFRLKFQKYTCK